LNVQLGNLSAFWVGGALYREVGGDAILLEAPAGVASRLAEAQLGALRMVVLSSDRMASVGGLVGLLAAIEPHRDQQHALGLRVGLDAERGAMLAETWVRGWPGRYPLTVDAGLPHASFSVGPFTIDSLPVRGGEARFRDGHVDAVSTTALRVSAAGHSVVWVGGAAPSEALSRFVVGASLAVVEVGVVPWPRTEIRWRMSAAEGASLAAEASQAWLVGDDGSPLSAAEA
jgi:hypothetical protein